MKLSFGKYFKLDFLCRKLGLAASVFATTLALSLTVFFGIILKSPARLPLPSKWDESPVEVQAAIKEGFPSPCFVNRYIDLASAGQPDAACVAGGLWQSSQTPIHVAAEVFNVLEHESVGDFLYASFAFVLVLSSDDNCRWYLQNQFTAAWNKVAANNPRSKTMSWAQRAAIRPPF